MVRGFSKVVIAGNVTRDPELRTTPSGQQVCSFSVAVNRVYKGEESVSYFNCTAWGKLGETISSYAKRGTGILVSGRLEQRSWDDKESGQKRSTVDIIVDDFNFIGGNADGGSAEPRSSKKNSKSEEVIPDDAEIEDEPIDLSDVPF